jgi:hypothetical protein
MEGLLRHNGISAVEKVSITGYVTTVVDWIIKASGGMEYRERAVRRLS